MVAPNSSPSRVKRELGPTLDGLKNRLLLPVTLQCLKGGRFEWCSQCSQISLKRVFSVCMCVCVCVCVCVVNVSVCLCVCVLYIDV